MEFKEISSLEEAQAAFERISLLDIQLHDAHAEWRKLAKGIRWDGATWTEKNGGVELLIPVDLPGTFSVYYPVDSTRGAPIKTRLWVRRLGDGTWDFKLLTNLPDHLQSQEAGFSGMVLAEDWLTGQITYAVYEHGRVLSKLEWMSRHLQMGMEYQCHDKYVIGCVNDVCRPYYVGQECDWYYVGENETFPPPDEGGIDGGGGGGNGGDNGGDPLDPPPTKPEEEDLLEQIEDKPFALFGDLDCDEIRKWLATAKHQVQQAQITKLNQIVHSSTTRPGITTTTVARLQDINNAYSSVVNMDYYPITISQMPIINGVRQTPEQFLEYIRKNMNSFVNTNYAEFEPYQWYGIDETTLWNSSNPLGAVIGIDMGAVLGVFDDNGSVIVSKYSSSGWTFSTIFDPKYGNHPVSGHRDFGFEQNTDGSYTFYTRGVDRLTTWDVSLFDYLTDIPFDMGDNLWTSFQNLVSSYVNQNSGTASTTYVKPERPDWQKIKDVMDGKLPLSTLSTDCPD